MHPRPRRRQSARHAHRRADGRFAALPASAGSSDTDEASIDTIDYGPYPVGTTKPGAPGPCVGTWENVSLDLPPVEDTESIQLALIDVIQALAANQIDAKRAGLLLYGLQVASANASKLNLSLGGVRSVTFTEEGTPLAPQDYGYDVEDYEDDEDEEEDDD